MKCQAVILLAAFLVSVPTVVGDSSEKEGCASAPFITDYSPTGPQLEIESTVRVRFNDPDDCVSVVIMFIDNERVTPAVYRENGSAFVWYTAYYPPGPHRVWFGIGDSSRAYDSVEWWFGTLTNFVVPEGQIPFLGFGVGVTGPQELGFGQACVSFVVCVGPFWTPSPLILDADVDVYPSGWVGLKFDKVGPIESGSGPAQVTLCAPYCPSPRVVTASARIVASVETDSFAATWDRTIAV